MKLAPCTWYMKLWIMINQGEEVEYLADVVKRVVLSLGKGGSSSAAGWEGLQCDNFVYNKIRFD